MRVRQTYRLYGLTVASELPLCGRRVDQGAPDVVINWGPDLEIDESVPAGRLITEFLWNGARMWTAVEDDGGHLFVFHRTCSFRVQPDLCRVVCTRDPHVDEELVSLLACGAFVAYLLTLRGRPPLHASAVELEGRAWGVVGSSRSGKSTLSGLLCAIGGRLIADDVLALQLDGQTVTCHRGCETLRLRESSVGVAELFPTPPRQEQTIDGRLGIWPPVTPLDTVELATVILPTPARTASVGVTVVDPLQVPFALAPHARVGQVRSPRLLQEQFELWADLATRVPVVRADLPWGPPFSTSVAHQLVDAVNAVLERPGQSTESL